jgi:amidase
MGDDFAGLDAMAQAELVRLGQVSALELVDATIARIERLEPAVHAFTTTRFDRAREEAAGELPDGPFRGVPFALKDLTCTLAGEPASDGVKVLKDSDWRAPVTSHLAARFRSAGLVVVGRTNTPELGIMPTTEPLAWGPTHNPWDLARTPGGSSGGSAAAVAAGMLPFAHASDGGGSIRIPAACCGLVGLKTSRGRTSVGPASDELARPLSVQFAVTRSVRDAAALLDAVAGPETGDPVTPPPPTNRYASGS